MAIRALRNLFCVIGVRALLLVFFPTLSWLQNASAGKIIADNFVFKKMSVDIFVKTYQGYDTLESLLEFFRISF